MSQPDFSKGELARALLDKLNLVFRKGKERNAWFVLDERKILRVTMPKGRGHLKSGTANAIRNQIKLSKEEYANLVKCPLTGKGYEEIIRDKIDRGIL